MEITGVCLTLSGPMDCNLLGSSVHGIFQARILERVAVSYPSGSSPPRNQSYCLLHLLHWQNYLPLAPPGKQGMQLDSKIFLNPGTLKPLKLFFSVHSLWFSASFSLAKGLHSRIYNSQRILSLQIIKGGTYSFQFTGKRLPALAGAMCPFLE